MFDVFTEQIEVLIKGGISNLYWYKGDLQKAWLRVGVSAEICREIDRFKDEEGQPLSKRRRMDQLYERLRSADFNLRLRISREFVRTLVEHKNFVPQDPKRRIEIAERAALKLRELIAAQEKEKGNRARQESVARPPSYDSQLATVRDEFNRAYSLDPQARGYALEKVFVNLMRISNIHVEEPFSNKGEQIDGAIKHEGIYYLIELKWVAGTVAPHHMGNFYFKVDGEMGARGIVIAMNGYSGGVLETLPKGKELKVLLMDGNHLANVINGLYRFEQLLNHAIKCASLQGELYCSHDIS